MLKLESNRNQSFSVAANEVTTFVDYALTDSRSNTMVQQSYKLNYVYSRFSSIRSKAVA